MVYISLRNQFEWQGKVYAHGEVIENFDQCRTRDFYVNLSYVKCVPVAPQLTPPKALDNKVDQPVVETQEEKCHDFDETTKASVLRAILADHGTEIKTFMKKAELLVLVKEACK